MNPLTALALTTLLCALPLAAHCQAHEHGAARLDIAVEAARLSLQFEAPLEVLFGFERAPRNAAERQLVDAGMARLKAADRLFKLDPAAGCTLQRTELNSAALKLGVPSTSAPAEHADLDATFEFACKDTSKLGAIEVGVFEAFTRLQRIDVQVATPKGQFKRSLKRPMTRISLLR